MNSFVNVGCKKETHAQAIKTVVSVNANLHIKSQRLRVLLGNKAIRHLRASVAVEKEGRLEVGTGSEGRLTGRGRDQGECRR